MYVFMYICIFLYIHSQKPALSVVIVASVASIVSVAPTLECCIVGRKKQKTIYFCWHCTLHVCWFAWNFPSVRN